MDSEEVLITGVDNNTECLCLGRNRTGKGKQAANPTRRRPKKSARDTDTGFLVIVDDSKEPEDGIQDGYIEVCGGGGGGGGGENAKIYLSSEKEADNNAVKNRKRCNFSPTAGDRDEQGTGIDLVLGKCSSVQGEASLIHEHLQTDIPPVFAAVPYSAPTALPPELLSADSSSSSSTTTTTSSITTSPPATLFSSPQLDGNHCKVSESYGMELSGEGGGGGGGGEETPPLSKPNLGTNSGGKNSQRTPTCWTNCPNCPPNKKRNYHLIDVAYNSAEWSVVSSPLTNVGYVVIRVQRIQNDALWQRLCYEKQLMLRDRPDVNEQLLYHTSKTSVAIICEEGLDLRLSMNGNFGCGIYFSDNPLKCNSYWAGGPTNRCMFCCRVLLGEVKHYPRGKSERLRREPPKENPKPGELKFYDSVMGNLTGQNEFVVYNAYRVMPEYVLHYMHTTVTNHVTPPHPPTLSSGFPVGFTNMMSFPAVLTSSRTKKKRKTTRKKK